MSDKISPEKIARMQALRAAGGMSFRAIAAAVGVARNTAVLWLVAGERERHRERVRQSDNYRARLKGTHALGRDRDTSPEWYGENECRAQAAMREAGIWYGSKP